MLIYLILLNELKTIDSYIHHNFNFKVWSTAMLPVYFDITGTLNSPYPERVLPLYYSFTLSATDISTFCYVLVNF